MPRKNCFLNLHPELERVAHLSIKKNFFSYFKLELLYSSSKTISDFHFICIFEDLKNA